MAEHIVRDSLRKKIMDQKSVFGNNVVELLTEIITNSDDSYSRIEANTGDTSPKIIDIYLDRRKSEFTIVDKAEGMSKQELISIFEEYASDTSGTKIGNNVRGMFGRGATDVLVESSMEGKANMMISIKNNVATKLSFTFDKNTGDRKFTDCDVLYEELNELRNKYKIFGNGTIVQFGTSRKIPKDIISQLEDYYMLRFLFDNEKRIVNFYDINDDSHVVVKKDMNYFNYCDVLCDEKLKFKYLDNILEGHLVLVHNKNKSADSRILVYDEKKAVYDNTFFGRDRDAGMNEIEGRLEIIGLTEFAKKMMNEKGETIITTTRDGFNVRHDFYVDVKNKVDKYIIAASTQISKDEEKPQSSLKNKKEWKTFFKDINRYFKNELETIIDGGGGDNENILPEDGLKFVRNAISVKKDKHYLIKLLVNSELIPQGSLITLKSTSESIELDKNNLIFTNDDEIPFVLVDIFGKELTESQQVLTAMCGDYSTNLYYDVIPEEIHNPSYGFDFFPNTLRKKPEVTRNATMYVDTSKFPLGSVIELNNSNNDIILDADSIVVSEEMLVSSNIAKIELPITGGKLGRQYDLTATINTREISLNIIVQENDDSTNNKDGLINDIIPKSASTDYVQSYYDDDNHIIVIVSNNVLNSMMLPNWIKTMEFKSDAEKYFFYNVLAEELARIMISKKSLGAMIEMASDPNDLFNKLSQEKDIMYKKIIQSFENR